VRCVHYNQQSVSAEHANQYRRTMQPLYPSNPSTGLQRHLAALLYWRYASIYTLVLHEGQQVLAERVLKLLLQPYASPVAVGAGLASALFDFETGF
jgi:hypothetical protein